MALSAGPNITVPTLEYSRDKKIWVNAILHNVFECVTIYYHIAIFDWILVKRHFL